MSDAFTYNMTRDMMRYAIGPERMARLALKQPGRAGLIMFLAARGDSAEDAAAQLGISVAELEALAIASGKTSNTQAEHAEST